MKNKIRVIYYRVIEIKFFFFLKEFQVCLIYWVYARIINYVGRWKSPFLIFCAILYVYIQLYETSARLYITLILQTPLKEPKAKLSLCKVKNTARVQSHVLLWLTAYIVLQACVFKYVPWLKSKLIKPRARARRQKEITHTPSSSLAFN